MPDVYGKVCTHMDRARRMLEYCRFAYKAYAQSCAFPLDPFYESWGPGFKKLPSARDRLIKKIHEQLGTSGDARKFDPVAYKLDKTINPHEGVVYRGGTDASFILLQPRATDLEITAAQGFDRKGKPVDKGVKLGAVSGNAKVGYFQGRTGMTENHPNSGWESYLGAVIYNPRHNNVVITFRGSRSGDGARAAMGAQFKSKGSADWVTDMNHLKGIKVDKFGKATLAIGFYYAFESCRESLEAAYRYAVGAKQPAAIYVTGHSLGGALAQVAYVDLVCGELGRDLSLRDNKVRKYCYPISSPPICHGAEAQHWLSLNAAASNIHHYYNPKDAVHASPLVFSTGASKLTGVLHTFTHPKTDPHHIGCEIALECDAGFPDAHEPECVWTGMNGGESEPGFWPTFELDVVSDTSNIKNFKAKGLVRELHAALRNSCETNAVIEHAAEWQAVIKDSGRKQLSDDGVSLFRNASGILDSLESVSGGGRTVSRARAALKKARRSLIDGGYKNPANHSASSSAYWTLLLGLAVRQVCLDAPPRSRPAPRPRSSRRNLLL
jgi:hypothetical protein